MIIILEGVDKAGKTTFAKLLAQKLHGEFLHFSKPDKDPMEYFMPALEHEKDGIVIADRHLLGEKIYAKVKKEPSQWKEGDYELMLNKLEEVYTVLVIVWEYKETLRKRHAELGETYITPKEMVTVQNLFLKEARRVAEAHPGIVVLTYKPTTNSIRWLGPRM